jgi:hypothetical protein
VIEAISHAIPIDFASTANHGRSRSSRAVLRLLLVLAALVNGAAAEISFEQLKEILPGHTVALRVPFKGSEIYFDLEGRPFPPYVRGTLGRDGFVTISDVTRDDHNNVILSGHRAILLSFAPDEPLQLITTGEAARIYFVVVSQTPEELGRRIAQIIHSASENKQLISAYKVALTQNVTLGEREVTTECHLRTMATPITRTLSRKKIEANVIINEFGEPDAVAFRSGLKKNREKADAATSIWNWRFAPVRSNGKLISCSQALTIDTMKVSLLPNPSEHAIDLVRLPGRRHR